MKLLYQYFAEQSIKKPQTQLLLRSSQVIRSTASIFKKLLSKVKNYYYETLPRDSTPQSILPTNYAIAYSHQSFLKTQV